MRIPRGFKASLTLFAHVKEESRTLSKRYAEADSMPLEVNVPPIKEGYIIVGHKR